MRGYDYYLYGQLLQVFLHLLDDDEKRAPHIVKLHDALRRIHHKPKMSLDPTYYEASFIVQRAMEASWGEIPDGKTVTINAICWMIFNRHKDKMKHYKLNMKHFEKMSRQGVSGYALETAKVLNLIEKHIAEQIKMKEM